MLSFLEGKIYPGFPPSIAMGNLAEQLRGKPRKGGPYIESFRFARESHVT